MVKFDIFYLHPVKMQQIYQRFSGHCFHLLCVCSLLRMHCNWSVSVCHWTCSTISCRYMIMAADRRTVTVSSKSVIFCTESIASNRCRPRRIRVFFNKFFILIFSIHVKVCREPREYRDGYGFLYDFTSIWMTLFGETIIIEILH